GKCAGRRGGRGPRQRHDPRPRGWLGPRVRGPRRRPAAGARRAPPDLCAERLTAAWPRAAGDERTDDGRRLRQPPSLDLLDLELRAFDRGQPRTVAVAAGGDEPPRRVEPPLPAGRAWDTCARVP